MAKWENPSDLGIMGQGSIRPARWIRLEIFPFSPGFLFEKKEETKLRFERKPANIRSHNWLLIRRTFGWFGGPVFKMHRIELDIFWSWEREKNIYLAIDSNKGQIIMK